MQTGDIIIFPDFRRDPRIAVVAHKVGVRRNEVIGVIVGLWHDVARFGSHTSLEHLSREVIDADSGIPGLGDALAQVEIIGDTEDGMWVYGANEGRIDFRAYDAAIKTLEKQANRHRFGKASEWVCGQVYVAWAAGTTMVKIGFTAHGAVKRIAKLNTGSPHKIHLLAVRDGSLFDEQEFHKQFAAIRVNGEWFDLDSELRAVLETQFGVEFTDAGLPLRDHFRDEIDHGEITTGAV